MIYPVVEARAVADGKKNYVALRDAWMKNFNEAAAAKRTSKRDSGT